MKNSGLLIIILFLTFATGFLWGTFFDSHVNQKPITCAKVSMGIVCWHGVKGKEWGIN